MDQMTNTTTTAPARNPDTPRLEYTGGELADIRIGLADNC